MANKIFINYLFKENLKNQTNLTEKQVKSSENNAQNNIWTLTQ